jgi:hypothetical protein
MSSILSYSNSILIILLNQKEERSHHLSSGKNNKNIPMTSQPVFGKLFISLCPNNGEVKKYGTHREYQRQIIFQLIEELGFNTQVYIEPAIRRATPGHIQIVPKYLHQCVHLLYLTDFIIIPNTPEITSPRLY